ncbi:glycoside hydrolase family 88/105 protein [Dysgonomonas macrotermitis]|uniref:Rhamnogalacturonyl hydrolase YesR n=1 Tax=Dysgonomonas macrotermitis TaxID=1346286 RepID=A0A1M4WHJ0_9BACT|nr:glycoside hydrolase family 88 protein [Dysgonomonas macrotermitis]SHE80709.1 Rhamnogalacturonyl hydrolase YesR [Dysgonomonas macrotermitis]
MKKHIAWAFFCLITIVSCSEDTTRNKEIDLINKVAEWQIVHFPDTMAPEAGWVHAALYRGLIEWGEYQESKEIDSFLIQVGEDLNWGMLDRVYDADDLCIGQTYIRLYKRYNRPEMINKVVDRVNFIMANPMDGSLRTVKNKPNRDRWGWCDALFMAPPVYAQLYKLKLYEKYLDFCFSEFQVTCDSLYDKQKHLFIRDLRFTDAKEANGEKVFWSRGNGWVYSGLTFMLNDVPAWHVSYNYYLNLYKEMTDAIIACQDKNGSWHTSMSDLEAYPHPENSASGFFVHGLAWGINKGILDKDKYMPSVEKGWCALKSYVKEDGKLGYVQPIGHAPRTIDDEMTAPYGVGAFLLAATEVMKLNR